MNTEILELLRQNSHPRDWQKLAPLMNLHVASQIDGQPVYEFYNTLDDSLAVNPQSIAISVQPVNSYIPFHLHDYVEVMMPLLGDCTVVTRREKIAVGQDDLLVMGNQTAHRVESIKTGSIVVNLALKQSAFTLNDFDFMRPTNNNAAISTMLFSLMSNEQRDNASYNLFKTQHNAKIVDTVYDIIREYYRPDTQSNQIIRLEILTLLTRLIRVAAHSDLKVKTVAGEPTTNLLSLLLYIEKNYATITLAEMAKHFGFNPNYLSAYLKKQTGLTFIKLVHLQRINTAAEYLTYTKAPVDQIAIKVGYENPSYFYKVFRKHLQVSPTEYREKNQIHPQQQ